MLAIRYTSGTIEYNLTGTTGFDGFVHSLSDVCEFEGSADPTREEPAEPLYKLLVRVCNLFWCCLLHEGIQPKPLNSFVLVVKATDVYVTQPLFGQPSVVYHC